MYAKQPIGFCNLGHYLINMVTRFLADLEIMMEVKNILVGGTTIKEAVERFCKFLLYCKKEVTVWLHHIFC